MQPLIEEFVNPPSSVQVLERLKGSRHCFFLDSGMDPAKLGRYSFIGSDPFLVMKSKGLQISINGPYRLSTAFGNPFDMLGSLLEQYQLTSDFADFPFIGGAVGYLSYDLGHFIERLPSTTVDDLQLPECYFAFYDAVIIFDHAESRVYISSTGFPEKGALQQDRARSRLAELHQLLAEASNVESDIDEISTRHDGLVHMSSNFTHESYIKAVDAAREYIKAGDIFQVNLSQRFEGDMPLPAYELYIKLRRINPAPFSAFLNFEEVAVVSSSPERFLRVRGDMVETRPIKGTRPRGKDYASDQALAQELVTSVKDKAEHVMIVDLERNDLGRVCRYGTVRVTELMALEEYATVFHLTSTVEGQLVQDKGIIDLLKATFPGGSITGAPKVRAMEIIDELEPTKRSVYTGSIGYIGFDGGADLNIVIRTILVKEGKAYFQVGGGIVYDSDPEDEYRETMDKAKALIQALCMVPELVTEVRR